MALDIRQAVLFTEDFKVYKKSIAFILCVAAGVLWMNQVLEHPLRPINTDTTVNSVNSFDAFSENSLDLIVYGSSHAWCGIDTGMLYDEYGIEGYNYGCAWQHVNTTQLFLEDSLLSQKPKAVIFETDMLIEPLQDTEMCGEIYYSKKVGSTKAKQNYLKQCFGTKLSRYIGYFLPALVFHENWKELSAESFMENSNEYDFVKNRGYLGSSSEEAVKIEAYETFLQEDIPEDIFMILNEMVQRCKALGIEVILCSIPFEGEYKYGEAVKAYAEKQGLTYLNYFEKMDILELDRDRDFRNAEHVNDSGARKITADLGAYLTEKYDLGAE